jgi:hypothetical protein
MASGKSSKEGEESREKALVARLRQFVEDSDLNFYKIAARVGTFLELGKGFRLCRQPISSQMLATKISISTCVGNFCGAGCLPASIDSGKGTGHW